MLSKIQNKGVDVLEDGVGAAIYWMHWTCPRGSYLFDYHHRSLYQGRKWSWQVGIHKIIACRSHVVPQREFYWLQNGYVLVLCVCWSCRRLLLGRLFFICKLLSPFLENSCDYEWFLVSLNSSLVDRCLGDGETTQSDYFNRRVGSQSHPDALWGFGFETSLLTPQKSIRVNWMSCVELGPIWLEIEIDENYSVECLLSFRCQWRKAHCT